MFETTVKRSVGFGEHHNAGDFTRAVNKSKFMPSNQIKYLKNLRIVKSNQIIFGFSSNQIKSNISNFENSSNQIKSNN